MENKSYPLITYSEAMADQERVESLSKTEPRNVPTWVLLIGLVLVVLILF